METVVAFCENGRELAAARRIEPEAAYAALTPEAAWECQRHGVPYLKLDDCYDEADLLSQHQAVHAEELAWAAWVDRFVEERMEFFRRVKLSPTRSYWYLLQHLWDGFYCAAWIAGRCLDRWRPAKILCGGWQPYPPPPFLQHSESVYGAVLPELAARRGIAAEMLPGEAAPGGAPAKSARLKSLAGRLLGGRAREEMRLVHNVGWREWLAAIAPGRPLSGTRVLVLQPSYDLAPVVTALRARGCAVDMLPVSVPERPAGRRDPQFEAVWGEMAGRAEFWAPLERWGLGRNPRAESALAFWWLELVPALCQAHRRAEALFEGRPYSAVLAWDFGAATTSAAVIAAARRGGRAPTFVYVHGSSMRIPLVHWHSMLRLPDYLLVYGEKTAERVAGGDAARPLVVGSARLDQLRRAHEGRGREGGLRRRLQGGRPCPLVLYAPHSFNEYARPLGDLAGYPSVSYFELQQRVLRLFAAAPHVRLIYKALRTANGGHNPVPEFIREHVPNAITVYEPGFAELAWAVDAIIVDHAVTALSEALMTRKPVVVYDEDRTGALLEPAGARELLRRRARLALTAEEFEQAVRDLLASDHFAELAEPDDGFLRAFCTHLNDGRSAERAADAVMAAGGVARRAVNAEAQWV